MTHEPDIVATPWGPMDRLDASYRVLQDMITIHESIVARNDAAESKLAEAIARMDDARKLRDGVMDLLHRLDAHIALQEQRKADEARKATFDEEPLTLPPDISEYQTRTPPSEIGDATHQPGGELHSVGPKQEPSSELPEPPLEDADNIGDLPPELVEEPEPVPEPKGSVLAPPTALFGN